MARDFTQDGLGVRVGDGYCIVIERMPGVDGWVENGRRYPLPLPGGFDSAVTIPAGRLGFAVRAYELAHPEDNLPELLTKKPRVLKAE
jgi:hypothetical protein